MKLYKKHFEELSTFELYKIYKARVAVFVVEQSCPYQEVDDADREADHLWIEDENQNLVAYARAIKPGVLGDDAIIGRVLSLRRKEGLGTKIVKAAIEWISQQYHVSRITVEAQTYAKKLYENLGFKQVSAEYLLDDIPHVKMTLDL